MIEESLEILADAGFFLPPFATWTTDHWSDAGLEWEMARQARLGWDVTDFGLGNFPEIGRVLFTMRNGSSGGVDKPYAEKIIIGRHGQRAPAHYHLRKIEDIINRGGGQVVMCLNPPVDKRLPAYVYQDGREMTVTPNMIVRLEPGESVCLPPGITHQFWGEITTHGKIPLIGEVSSYCDDVNDNVFFDDVARFMTLVDDEPARFCLCHELPEAQSSRQIMVPEAQAA